MELSDKQLKRIKKLEKFSEDKDLSTLENLLELDEKIDEVKSEIDTKFSSLQEELKKKLESELVLEIDRDELKGQDGYTPKKGVDYFDGEDYKLTSEDKKEIASSIEVPVVEKVIEKTEVIRETPIVTEVVKEVAVKDNGEEIISKINEDKTSLIKEEKIDGLKERFEATQQDLLNRAVSIVDNRTSFLINKVSNLAEKVNNFSPSDSDEKVKYDASDPTAGYIADKFVAGSGITLAEGTGGNENKLVITNSFAESQDLQAVTDLGNTTTNDIEANSFITTGGTSSDFVKGDGSLDSSDYLTGEDLPSTLILYPTTTASVIGGYTRIVTDMSDPDYDDTAVDVPTGAISGTNQLLASLATDAGIVVGDLGIFNVNVVGNIRKTGGATVSTATFHYEIYKRDSGGTETLIATSNQTLEVTESFYVQFFATALFNDGTFTATDRIVLKFYGTKVGGGTSPTYDFQFGGMLPVRASFPVPVDALLSNYFNKTTDDTDDITDTATNRFTNDTDITRLANTSGTNTGDQDLTGYALLDGTNQPFTGDIEIDKANPEFRMKHATDQEFWLNKSDDDVTSFNQNILVQAQAGNGISFASTQYGKVSSVTSTASWTINYWINRSGLTGTIINFGFGDAPNSSKWRIISTASNTFRFNTFNNVGGGANSSTFVLTPDVWEMHTITYSGGTFSFHLNGNATPAVTLTSAQDIITADLSIGAELNGTNQINAIFDELIRYDSVLSSADMATLYSSGNPSYRPITSGQLNGWSFDQTSGTTVTDYVSSVVMNLFNTPLFVTGIVPTPSVIETAEFIKVTRSMTGGVKGIVNIGSGATDVILDSKRVIAKIDNIERMKFIATQIQLGSTDGNARGDGTIDMQTARTSATQVASTQNSIIIGLRNTTENGTGQLVLGADNLAYGRFSAGNADSRCIVLGAFNTIGQSGTTVGGYQACVIGVSNNVHTQSGLNEAWVLGKGNNVQGASGVVGGGNFLGIGQQAFLLGGSNFLHGSGSNGLVGVNNIIYNADVFFLGKNSFVGANTSAVVGGYSNISGSNSSSLGFTHTIGYARRATTFTVSATTCTISGDVTTEFAVGETVSYMYIQNGQYLRGTATLTGVSFGSGVTTLTRSGAWVSTSGAISGGFTSSTTKGSGSTAIGNTVVVRAQNAIAIGRNLTTTTNGIVELGTDNATKMQYDSSGNLFIRGDFETLGGSAKGLILESPDATRWRITVDDTGTLQVNSI